MDLAVALCIFTAVSHLIRLKNNVIYIHQSIVLRSQGCVGLGGG